MEAGRACRNGPLGRLGANGRHDTLQAGGPRCREGVPEVDPRLSALASSALRARHREGSVDLHDCSATPPVRTPRPQWEAGRRWTPGKPCTSPTATRAAHTTRGRYRASVAGLRERGTEGSL